MSNLRVKLGFFYFQDVIENTVGKFMLLSANSVFVIGNPGCPKCKENYRNLLILF
jgi:hypothetical protein